MGAKCDDRHKDVEFGWQKKTYPKSAKHQVWRIRWPTKKNITESKARNGSSVFTMWPCAIQLSRARDREPKSKMKRKNDCLSIFFSFGGMCFVFDVSISTVPQKLVPRTKKKHCCRIHTPTRPTIPTLILLQSNFFISENET